MRTLIRLLLVASVLYGTGAHWAALQTAAWADMLATRASESSWREAVTSTFSGEKPCHMCRIVEKGSRADPGPAVLRSSPGVDLAISVVPAFAVVLTACVPALPPSPSVLRSSSRPSVPPPKTGLPA